MVIRPFTPADEEAVVALWQACELTRPWNDPRRDIARKLAVNPELFLVGVLDGRVAATAMAGYEGHRGWVNYLAVHPDRRRRGLGQQMMNAAEERLRARGCPKINLQIRTDNSSALAFYARLGYQTDAAVSMGKRLVEDGPSPGK
jgi:ribosomal protein S18 acetylase RimI-like enzyme